jgi:hypothetical protein
LGERPVGADGLDRNLAPEWRRQPADGPGRPQGVVLTGFVIGGFKCVGVFRGTDLAGDQRKQVPTVEERCPAILGRWRASEEIVVSSKLGEFNREGRQLRDRTPVPLRR